MPKIILCIDDMPQRYTNLAFRLGAADKPITVVVTCRMEDVRFYTENKCYEIIGVCLDHDMPFQDGMYFAIHYLREHNWPVAITSANPFGAEDIFKELDYCDTPCKKIPVTDRNFTPQLMEYFKLR